jgi:GDP-4-dehydro-6-deoxy-D-mannose reductase
VDVGVEVDEARLRPAETPRIFGSYERIREAVGWEPEIPLDRTLGDLLNWWRDRISQ